MTRSEWSRPPNSGGRELAALADEVSEADVTLSAPDETTLVSRSALPGVLLDLVGQLGSADAPDASPNPEAC